MGKSFFEWLWEKERKNKQKWEPVPLELPIDDSFIVPPTTSSTDIETDTPTDKTIIMDLL